ncbi:MAG: hypothetical protein U1F16_06375 [Turneriella sp.]
MKRRVAKVALITIAILLAIGAMVLIKEYLLLKKIERAMKSPSPAQAEAKSGTDSAESAEPRRQAFVTKVTRQSGGDQVTAYVNFAAFRRTVEAQPEAISRWGSLRWKVLEDTPALCIRNLAQTTPFSALGVAAGDCITHLDGESINQPMRNLGIWLSLARRERLTVDTLRGDRKISYTLLKQRQ